MAKCPNEGDCEISLRREAQLQPWRAQSEKACLLSSLFGTQISDILSALDQSNVENMLGIHPSALGEKKHIHWTLFDMLPTTVSRTDVRLVGYWPVSLSCAHTRRTSAKTYQICLALSRKKKNSLRGSPISWTHSIWREEKLHAASIYNLLIDWHFFWKCRIVNELHKTAKDVT